MSNEPQKKPPTPEDVLRRMLSTPPQPHPKPKAKPAKPKKK